MSDEDEFVRKCNEFKKELEAMGEEERDRAVRDILEWLVDAYVNIANAYSRWPLKAIRIMREYKKEIEENRHKIAVCLVYAVKEEYQELMSKIFMNMFSLFF